MRMLVENRFALLGLVVVALGALFGVAHVTRAGAGETAPQGDPVVTRVESAVRVCPPPPENGHDAEIATFTPPGTGGDEGRMVAVANTAEGEELGTAERPGRVWTPDGSESERYTVVRATAAMAAGLEAVATTAGADPYAAEARCVAPTLNAWFLVPGGGSLDTLELRLANVEDTPATVNLDIYAPDGPIYDERTRGISIEAHDEREIALTELTETADVAAVRVRTNRGRVAPFLFADAGGSGADWVPPAASPAKRLVIPGIAQGGGSRRLIVSTVGDEPARATVRGLTTEGEVEHEILERVDVPPAASTTLGLEGPLGGRAATVVVESDQPLVAGVAMDRDGGDGSSYAAAAPPLRAPLDGRAIVPAMAESDAVALGAPSEEATVRLTPVSPEGETRETESVTVEAGHTVLPELSDLHDGDTLLVEVAEEAGPVYAGRVVTRGSGDDRATAARPLLPAPDAVALPSTSDTLSTVVP